MPVPPPPPFIPARYVIEGEPNSVRTAGLGWIDFSQRILRSLTAASVTVAAAPFEGPEAELWRERGAAHFDALAEAAQGIQKAGESLGAWAAALDRAIASMIPLSQAAVVDHANLQRAVGRVIAAEAAEVAAAANVASAQSALAAATAAGVATAGVASPALLAAQSYLAAAIAELGRATAEVVAAHIDHQAAMAAWEAVNAAADAVQNQLGVDANQAATQVDSGTAHRSGVQDARNQAAGLMQQAQAHAAGLAGLATAFSAVTEKFRVDTGVEEFYSSSTSMSAGQGSGADAGSESGEHRSATGHGAQGSPASMNRDQWGFASGGSSDITVPEAGTSSPSSHTEDAGSQSASSSSSATDGPAGFGLPGMSRGGASRGKKKKSNDDKDDDQRTSTAEGGRAARSSHAS